MDPLVSILVPGLAAVASAMLAWFVMESRMEVKLAEERERLAGQREGLAEQRGELKAEKAGLGSTLQSAMRAAEETARRHNWLRCLRRGLSATAISPPDCCLPPSLPW